jgi:hypothetical protein
VGHLPAFEAQRGLHLVAFIQEADRLVLLGLVVVLIHGDGELDLLHHDDLLFLARSPVALVLFIKELAVVLNAAHGWYGGWGDFHQIQAALAGNLQGFKRLHDAELFSLIVNHANLFRANAVVGADERLG